MRRLKSIQDLFENSKTKYITKPNDPLQPSILYTVQEHILDFHNRYHDSRLIYHNYQRTVEIVSIVDDMGRAIALSEEGLEIVQLAAWFHNTGFFQDYSNPQDKSINLATAFLQTRRYPAHKLDKAMECINATKVDEKPISIEAQLLVDAINAFSYTTNFGELNPLLRLEWEFISNKKLTNFEWSTIQLQTLLSTRFYTPYAKVHFEPLIAQNILTQKRKVEKNKGNKYPVPTNNNDGLPRKFNNIEKRTPNDAIQTFFRANYRNHINLSAIADNKANIMISVNAILISVLISILTYQNITDTNPMVLLPVVIFLMTGLTSLIFAVLSIRPKVTTKNKVDTDPEVIKKNIVFFGNFVHLSLEQYEEAVDAIFRNGELIYGNMVRDIYFLGKVLDKKYRYLTMSYNIFMVGFVATVLTFLIAIFS